MKSIQRILVVSRMNSYNLEAIRTGVSLARSNDAKLTVLHLTPNPVDMVPLTAPGAFREDDFMNYLNIQQEVKKQLDAVIKKELKEGFPIKEMVSDGEPVAEIAKVVAAEKINLIVMLAHQEGRLEHALFGGENDAIIRTMPCSILLVKKEPEQVAW
jgi:nucleotide-binding universal stress UspA family protein